MVNICPKKESLKKGKGWQVVTVLFTFRRENVEVAEADEEFTLTAGTEEDDEQTLDEEERMEEELDHKNEIDDLQKEGMWQLFFYYRSYSVIRRTVFSKKSVFRWQVSAKIGVRLIAKYFRATKS